MSQAKKEIRVLYVVDLGHELVARGMLELASRLPRGHFQTAVACPPGSELVAALQDRGVTVLPLERAGRTRLDSLVALGREIGLGRPHLVHLHGCAGADRPLAARLAGAQAVVCAWTAATGSSRPRGGWRPAGRRLSAWVADRLVDRYVVTSRDAARVLTDDKGIGPSRVAVIPPGIELERFDPRRVHRGVWRARLGAPGGVTLAGASGRLARHGAVADLLRALALVDFIDLWLVIVGEGPDREEIEQLTRTLGLQGRVFFPGRVHDPAELLADLDLFVSVEREADGAPGLLEAMAMARPVLACDVMGAADAITEGLDGRLVPMGDTAALAQGISRLIRDPQAAQRLGRNARRKVEREFSVERMVRRTALLYEQLLAGKRLE